MRVLVTGVAGFIGHHVASRLAARGDTLIGIDHLRRPDELGPLRLRAQGLDVAAAAGGGRCASARWPNYTFVRADLTDPDAIARAVGPRGVDRICHLAAEVGVRRSAEVPAAYGATNLMGTLYVLEAARRLEVSHLVFASSSSVYGEAGEAPSRVSDRADRPLSLYAATKRSGELMAHSYSHTFGLPATGLRFFTVYGPWGRPDMACFIFTKAILAGRPIPVYGGGDMTRDFTYVDDIAEGVVRVLDRPPAAGARPPWRLYNIGRGEPVRILDFIGALETALGRSARLAFMPLQPGDVRATSSDTSALVRDHGYRPIVSLTEGISRFVAWYRDIYAPRRPGG